MVSEPTRGENVLDLALTDVANTKAHVIPGVSDHRAVLTTLTFSVPATEERGRLVWQFAEAGWELLVHKFTEHSWQAMTDMDPDECAQFFTESVLEISEGCIPRVCKHFKQSTHP